MAEKNVIKVKSVFETLNAIDVSKYAEKKGNLTYLSWPWAWGKVKENYPEATYKIYENANGMIYHTDGRTCWVKTGVTINGIENIEYLPVMDNRNQSIPLERVTSRNVNDSIQRSLTKACARHGLGLYIYAGEDLPESAKEEKQNSQTPAPQPAPQLVQQAAFSPQIQNEINVSKTTDDLLAIWNKYTTLWHDAQFSGAVTARKDQILKNGKS